MFLFQTNVDRVLQRGEKRTSEAKCKMTPVMIIASQLPRGQEENEIDVQHKKRTHRKILSLLIT